MLTGLSAFPLTPVVDDDVDLAGYARLVSNLAEAGVDSIGALGSTGSYAYLDRDERRRVARTAVEAAGSTPVVVGIGALRESRVRDLADDAQEAGASALLLAPMTYQGLSAEEVFGLYESVAAGISVPLVVYDNPATTRFAFSDDLYRRICSLPNVASIKMPGVPRDPGTARRRIADLREQLPAGIGLGVSGDAFGAAGLIAGCDIWYSVIAGVLPGHAVAITRAAQDGDHALAAALSDELGGLWDLFAAHGSVRVASAAAAHLGLLPQQNLPRPVHGLDAHGHAQVRRALEDLDAGVLDTPACHAAEFKVRNAAT